VDGYRRLELGPRGLPAEAGGLEAGGGGDHPRGRGLIALVEQADRGVALASGFGLVGRGSGDVVMVE
jgi:hypothetical protein